MSSITAIAITRLGRAGGLAALATGLGGCALVSPAPAWELLKAASVAAQAGLAQQNLRATGTVHHGQAMPSALCIEFNPDAPVPDLVPVLQQELRRHDVDSRVYARGAPAPACSHWLRYTAAIAWDRLALGGEPAAYLRQATLTLQQGDGRVLASSGYDLDATAIGNKWAGTRAKLAPVVEALVYGQDS